MSHERRAGAPQKRRITRLSSIDRGKMSSSCCWPSFFFLSFSCIIAFHTISCVFLVKQEYNDRRGEWGGGRDNASCWANMDGQGRREGGVWWSIDNILWWRRRGKSDHSSRLRARLSWLSLELIDDSSSLLLLLRCNWLVSPWNFNLFIEV